MLDVSVSFLLEIRSWRRYWFWCLSKSFSLYKCFFLLQLLCMIISIHTPRPKKMNWISNSPFFKFFFFLWQYQQMFFFKSMKWLEKKTIYVILPTDPFWYVMLWKSPSQITNMNNSSLSPPKLLLRHASLSFTMITFFVVISCGIASPTYYIPLIYRINATPIVLILAS